MYIIFLLHFIKIRKCCIFFWCSLFKWHRNWSTSQIVKNNFMTKKEYYLSIVIKSSLGFVCLFGFFSVLLLLVFFWVLFLYFKVMFDTLNRIKQISVPSGRYTQNYCVCPLPYGYLMAYLCWQLDLLLLTILICC